jgi:hypothetical protein
MLVPRSATVWQLYPLTDRLVVYLSLCGATKGLEAILHMGVARQKRWLFIGMDMISREQVETAA